MMPNSIFSWYRILRVHYHWPMFQAIRYALWLRDRKQERKHRRPGVRLPVVGTRAWRSPRLFPFPGLPTLTLDFQLRIPDRYSFSAKSFQYYRILLNNCY